MFVGAAPAFAQDSRRVEIGSSLGSGLVFMPEDGDNHTWIGVPTAGFGLVNPAVYLSIFATPRLALEPQLGLVSMSNGSTERWVTVFGHLEYFAGNVEKSSPYLFAGGGFINMTDEDTIKAVDGGAGYRIRVGDRLTFRLDGRYTHYFDRNGNMLSFTLSIGGLLGK
jgi:hypothetical protein